MEKLTIPGQQILFILLLAILTCTQSSAAEVKIAVAANFADASRKLIPLFDKTTGHTVIASYESTGKLFAQIKNGAPYGLFLAVDRKRPQRAEQEGLAVPGKRFVYARGKLVLWSAAKSLFANGESYLNKRNFQHLAIANPRTAPYGLAARQVLQHLGLWSRIQNRLVLGESVAQTFQFVVSENAQAGFVAYSQVKAWRGASGTVWNVPTAYYSPIEQSVVLLKKGADNPAAQAFFSFLRSGPARSIIQNSGYDVEQ